MPCVALCNEGGAHGRSITVIQCYEEVQLGYTGRGVVLLSELDLLTHALPTQSKSKRTRSQ